MDELEIIRNWQMPGLRIFLNTVDYRTSHFHPEWELIWILENRLTVTLLQQEMTAAPGQLLLFSPNIPHEFRKVSAPATFLCLQIRTGLFPGLDGLSIDEYLPEKAMDTAPLRLAMAQAAAVCFRREPFFELKALSIVSRIFYSLFTALPGHRVTPEEQQSLERRNARLVRLQHYVDENYMHTLRLTDFALLEGLSVSYLSHFIKDSLNQTFQEYVENVRFNCACKLIASGRKGMLDVCMESGFSDYRYFSRAFQRRFGMTPEQYCISRSSEPQDDVSVRRSLHSLERFYTSSQSLEYMKHLGLL